MTQFAAWTGDVAYVANVTASSTTVTMPAQAITVTATYKDIPVTLYTLTVTGGSGGGDCAEGAVVNISADTPLSGKQFAAWTGDVAYVANVTASSTTVTMPAQAITVTATYKDIPVTLYTLTVTGGSGGGDYAEGTSVTITADAAPKGQAFSAWTGDVSYLASATASPATFIMPAVGPLSFTANYTNIGSPTLDLSIAPADQSVAVGDNVIIDVDVANVSDLAFANLTVPYDHTVLVVQNVIDGGFLSNGGFDPVLIAFDNTPGAPDGHVSNIVAVRTGLDGNGDPVPGVNGSGHLVRILFRAIASGSSALAIQDGTEDEPLRFTTPSSAPILVDTRTGANVTVSGGVTYIVAVTGGSGGGDYAEGTSVTITADAAPKGQAFSAWTGDVSYLASATASTATFIMPAVGPLSFTATYSAMAPPTEDPVITLTEAPEDGSTVSSSDVTIAATITDDVVVEEVEITVEEGEGLKRSRSYSIVTNNDTPEFSFSQQIALYEYGNTITITANNGTTVTTIERTVTLFTLSITAGPQSGMAPLEVTFQAHTKQGQGKREIVLYEWDFDGKGAYEMRSNDDAKAGHTFTGGDYSQVPAHTYTVRVHVMDENGNENTCSVNIEVLKDPDKSPVITKIDAEPTNGVAPLGVTFSADASDPDGEIALYEWDFDGDGAYDSSSEVSASVIKTYALAEAFVATLRVTDDEGLTATANRLITVTENASAPQISDFTATSTVGNNNAPLAVTFAVVVITESGIEAYEWDFDGDGVIDRVSTTPSANYSYPNVGSFAASVVVTDGNNLAAKDTVIIKVTGTLPGDLKPPSPRAKIEIEGDAPLLVDFKAEIGQVDGAQTYYFDFNGCGETGLTMTAEEYNAPGTEVTHTYQIPGTYRARVLVKGKGSAGWAGWIQEITMRIKVRKPQLSKVYIVAPKGGKIVAGTRITVVARVMPRLRKEMESLVFQYSVPVPGAADEWNDIGDPVTGRPFVVKWDTTSLVDGLAYFLRCVVTKNSGPTVASDIITVAVDNSAPAAPDMKENETGSPDTFEKEEKVKAGETSETEVADKTEVQLPPLTTADTLIIKGVSEEDVALPLSDPGKPSVKPLGAYREFKLESSAFTSFDEYATITIPYEPADGLDEKSITVYCFDEGAGAWKSLETEVYTNEKIAKAKTNHFSLFGLGGIFGSIFGGGGSGLLGGGGGGGCFIATAAYGTPMASEVQALCELRDRRLLKNEYGRQFVKFYYRTSPPVAHYISTKPRLKALVRKLLKPLVWLAKRLI